MFTRDAYIAWVAYQILIFKTSYKHKRYMRKPFKSVIYLNGDCATKF